MQETPYYEEYDALEWGRERKINLGGWWTPEYCDAIHHVALVVPYRDR